MRTIGGLLVLLGLGSIALKLLSMFDVLHLELKLLMWVETWGELPGWGIRAGFVVVGLLLLMLGGGGSKPAATA